MCYKNGRVYLNSIFVQHQNWVNPINKLLLIGYYLVNLGYITISLNFWENVTDIFILINSLVSRVGYILLILGGLHYFNIWALTQLSRKSILFK